MTSSRHRSVVDLASLVAWRRFLVRSSVAKILYIEGFTPQPSTSSSSTDIAFDNKFSRILF